MIIIRVLKLFETLFLAICFLAPAVVGLLDEAIFNI